MATIRVRGGTTVERSDAELASRPLPALNVRGQTMGQALHGVHWNMDTGYGNS